MKLIKISRICEQFPPAEGGLSSGMFDLSMAQHKLGHDITVFAPLSENSSEFDSKTPFTVTRIPSKRIFDFSWKACDALTKLSTPPDIVHTHGPAAFNYLIRRTNTDPPLVHTMHAVRKYQYNLLKQLPEMVKSFEKKSGLQVIQKPKSYNRISPNIFKAFFLEKYICRRVNHIVVVSKYFADQINSYYGVSYEKISVVYNGSKFNPQKVCSADNSKFHSYGINTQNDVILYVGRTDWAKRVHILVEAMPEVLRKYPHACLIIAGTGDQNRDLSQLVKKLRLSNSVKLLGWVPHDDLPELYNIARCFCLPSYWEGLSKAILDAMSTGVPVIATDNLSNREILHNGKFGWLVEEPTPEAWSKTMEVVLSGRVEVKVNRASKLIDTMYRWEHVAERIDVAYQKVLKHLS